MPRETIGNPLSWSAQTLAGAGRSFGNALDGISSHEMVRPEVSRIEVEDIRIAIHRGIEDFSALRSDVVVAVALYPVIGFVLAVWTFHAGALHLLFPLVAGFALIGPVAAVGLYEMSRRREQDLETSWGAVLDSLTGRVLGPVFMLGLALLAIFFFWLYAAHLIWAATLGPEPYDSLVAFLHDTFTSGAGWAMILVGMSVGFVFAAVALCISFVSFPMLIDRPVGVPIAVATSLAVARRNPRATATWGLVVVVALVLGTIPLFLGLVLVLPVLGHATWHLYRRAVELPDQV